MAETINIRGHADDEISAYLARPLGPGPYPGVVVIHHMPGWDAATKEITRTFAVHGYTAICPNLHHREGPDASPDDAAAAARAAGGVPDDRCLGDVAGGAAYVRSLPYSNGKVGVIGYCSGGRQTYLVACNLPVDAAVDCYGGRVVASEEDLSPRQPVAPIDMTGNLGCPLLGLFGTDDQNPSPEHVARTEEELKKHGKTYEFHSYDDAGHAFFATDRQSYRVHAALDGWQKIWAWFDKYLATPA
ncbi:MAG: prolyl oligopeptidase family serine peptidase [Streptosporangiales bacterium]|nr:prolyl oligopeptidase family serine peptidase [Streptosporangiales bacterium]